MPKRVYAILIIAIAFCISFITIPGEKKRGLLNLNDKNDKAAKEMCEQKVKKESDPNQNTIIPLADLYLQKGEITKAIATLEKLIEDEPKNKTAYRYLAKIYKNSQNTQEYMRTLEKLTEIDPDPEILREIANYNNFIQNEQGRLNSLEKLVKNNNATPTEVAQLARLYIAKKNTQRAIDLMMTTLPKVGAVALYENLYFLLALLLEDKNPLKAEEIAKSYISPQHMGASLDVIRHIAFLEEPELAFKLAQPLIEKNPSDPLLIAWRIDFLVSHKKIEEALNVFQNLVEKGDLPAKFEPDFIKLAMETEKDEHFVHALSLIDIKAQSLNTLMEIAEFILSKKLSSEAHYMKSKLGLDFLKDAPLLSLLLQIADKEDLSALTSEALSSIEPIKPPLRLKLARVFQETKLPNLAKTLLAKEFSFKESAESEIISLCEMLIELGLQEISLKIFQKEYPDRDIMPIKYQIAEALLLIACDKEEGVATWYRKASAQLDEEILEKLYYYAAARKAHKGLSEQLAERLYELKKDEDSKIRLAEAYLENQSYAKAEPFLKDLALKKKGFWGDDYVSALKKLNKRKELNQYWKVKVSTEGIDVKKKREIGFALFEGGDKKGAEAIFMELAQGKTPKHPDVEQLIFIWGKSFPPKAITWIENNAKKAPDRQKAEWLKILLNAGEFTKVINLIEEMNLTNKKGISEVYMEALENTKDRRGLQKVLSQEIDQKTDVESLIKFLDLASFSGNQSLEKKAFKKLLKLYPNHPYVLKVWAEKSIAKRKYAKAMATLEKLFAQGHEDVRSLYNYAEVIRNRQNLENAKPYYEKILNKLINSKEKNIEFDVIKAKSLYFTDKKNESICKYREILAHNKNNKVLKADIAHFLMDVGELKEAEAVLNG